MYSGEGSKYTVFDVYIGQFTESSQRKYLPCGTGDNTYLYVTLNSKTRSICVSVGLTYTACLFASIDVAISSAFLCNLLV